MATFMIPSTAIDGNYSVWFLPTVADIDAIKISEANGATAIPLACYLTGDGLNITVDEQKITDERLCSKQTFERAGRVQYGVEITYIDNTNSVELEAEYNKAAETFVKGVTGVIVTRRNLPHDKAAATGEKYNAYPVEAGVQQEVPVEANSVSRSKSVLNVTGDVVIGGAFVAGP